ncbi:hypothetical protein LOAG_06599 [Loa loa]|uniref:Interleukin-17 receptor B n=1 Tax=Loa loa TaxID=7209 RepID=A0A1I7VKT8_LOALO|nr:hypothetical protein LOAG_06599 [Loa loa]EFO21886.1 hypothetical protein LOAG_06599 [Loa loa]
MLRDLFYQLFPNVTAQELFCNIQNLKQQIISAQVRLVILKETDLEEKRFVLTRIAALQAEMEQQLLFFVVATRHDEVPRFRNWIEKQDTTYGPLYARTFKRWKGEQNWRPNLLYPPYLQHPPLIPLYLRYPSSPGIIFFGGVQNQLGMGYRFSDKDAVRNSNIPFLPNPSAIVPPDIMDSRSSTPPELPDLFADFQLPLQLSSSSENESTETT